MKLNKVEAMKGLHLKIFCLLLSWSPLKATDDLCAPFIKRMEDQEKIPSLLLHSISLVESGKAQKGETEVTAWPWTINVEGKGYVYQTKEEAVKAIQSFRQKGIKSIDVGCMQVNLYHHPKAFKTLEDALDPQQNVTYAAKHLKKLRQDLKSWSQAVAHYHSKNYKHYWNYRQKVYHRWNKIRRDLSLARYKAQREARYRKAASYKSQTAA